MIELVLNDNGNGVPDIAELDGVFSGNFIPESDGIYRISVEIDATSTSRIKNQIRPENFIGSSRLLPVDQNDIRPEEPIELDEDFLMTVNHLDITVKNRASLAAVRKRNKDNDIDQLIAYVGVIMVIFPFHRNS